MKPKEPYWMAPCRTAHGLHEDGLVSDALEYLVEGKFFPFVMSASSDPETSPEVEAFAKEVRSIFPRAELLPTLKKLNRGEYRTRHFATEETEKLQPIYDARREAFENACHELGFQEFSRY